MAQDLSTHTYGTTGVKNTTTTTASLKLWVQRFIDKMVATGWVQTSDTGQIVVGSITADLPVAPVNLGYLVFVQDDTYRLTDPIYMRFDCWVAGVGYNMSGSTFFCPQMPYEIGFGTDGAGAITGSKLSVGKHMDGQGWEFIPKPALDLFASGPGWATVAHGVGLGGSGANFYVRQICAVFFERVRDGSGVVIPGQLYVIYPEPDKRAMCGADDRQYRPYMDSKTTTDLTTQRLLGAFVDKNTGVRPGFVCAPGVIGMASSVGTVGGVVQAQPVWRALPQITPFGGLIIVPAAVFTAGQVFSASIDGVNQRDYVCLGAVKGLTDVVIQSSVGAMYAIDSYSQGEFCFAARVA